MPADCGGARGAVRCCVVHGAPVTRAGTKHDDGARAFRFRRTEAATDGADRHAPDRRPKPVPVRGKAREGSRGAGLGPAAAGR